MQDSLATSQSAAELELERNGHGQNSGDPAELLDAIKEITQRHFPEGPIAVESEYDPEVPSDEFFVLSVTASGPAKDIVERECRWHREVYDIARESSHLFRLLVQAVA
jgi:hypothetical protein